MVVVALALSAAFDAGEAIRLRAVWATEVAAGLTLAIAFVVSARRARGVRAGG